MAIIRGMAARFRVGRILVCSRKSLLLLSGGRFEGVSRPLRYYDAKEPVFQHLAIPLKMDGKTTGRCLTTGKTAVTV